MTITCLHSLSTMAKIPQFSSITLLLITLTFISSLTFSSCQATNSDTLIKCLTLGKVSNFTLNPVSYTTSSSDFHHILSFSIQNLRVAGDSFVKPTAIILPENKEQLIQAVGCCRRSLFDITIRCGGHSYEGLSSVPRGETPFVIIDMMNLNQVIVDVGSETAWVEGGVTLGELYYAIAEQSNYHGFPAGVGPTVGVSGHFSGGGIGVMGRKYGLSADNVLDAVLIDANGRDLGRAQMGEDVFWALRGGGGGNWGVVYGWKVQLVKVPERVTCFKVSKQGPNHELAKLIYKWQFVAPYLDDNFYLAVYLTSSVEHEVYVTFLGFYLGPKIEAISLIDQHFPDLVIGEEEYLEMSWIESILYFSGLPNGSTIHDLKSRYWTTKSYVKTKSDYVKKPISFEGLEGALELVALEPKGLVIFDPYGGIMDRISSDSIAFPHRKGNLYNILCAAFWVEEEEERYLSWIRKFYEYMTPFVSSNPRAAYVNYVDLDLGTTDFISDISDVASYGNAVKMARAWGEKYFLNNYDRLVRAKTLIDPHNVFSHRQGISPSNVHAHEEL